MKNIISILSLVLVASISKAQWTAVNSGLTNDTVLSLAVSGTKLFAGTFNGVYLSNNNGSSWTSISNGLPIHSKVNTIAVNGSNVFAGTDLGIFLSTNDGSNWISLNNPAFIAPNNIYAIIFYGTTTFVSSSTGVYKSINNGTSWIAANTGLPAPAVVSFLIEGTTIYAGSNGGGVYFSTDSGASWTACNTGLSNSFVQAFEIIGTKIFAATAVPGGVFLSNNSGNNWNQINNGLTSLYVNALKTYFNYIFAGTTDGGVFFSSDFGNNWISESAGLTNSFVTNLKIIGTSIFASTYGGGVFKRPLTEFGIDVGISETNSDFNIMVAPNPFSSNTTLVFTKEQNNTSIKITDNLGREVRTIDFSGKQLLIDKEQLESGIYFLQISDRSKNIITKKFIIE